MFPLKTAYLCHPLPHVIGPTVSEYYEVIRLPGIDVYVLAVRLTEHPSISIGLTQTMNV